MKRLDTLVRGILQDVRQRMDADGAAGEAAPPLARREGGGTERARKGDAHPRSSSRRMAKKATGMAAKISIER